MQVMRLRFMRYLVSYRHKVEYPHPSGAKMFLSYDMWGLFQRLQFIK